MTPTAHPAPATLDDEAPVPIAAILDSPLFGAAMRAVLAFPFWASGLAKMADFDGARAEMAMFGFQPAAAYAVAVIATQLLGSALVIHGRLAWLGAGWMAVFTLMTIPLVHSFWSLTGAGAIHAFHTAIEHVGICGGLALAAIQAHRAHPRG